VVHSFTRGFAAQIGTALTVLTATQLGLSVSTTHCLIGAITGVALVEGRDKINTDTIKKILMSWGVTLPMSALFTVLLYTLLQNTVMPYLSDGPLPGTVNSAGNSAAITAAVVSAGGAAAIP
jgi:RsiW-degrading membrane proteinase PrsW (M82 family)